MKVTSVTHIPISTLSIAIPTKAPDFFVLAIGKGSGSVEAFLCHPSSEKLVRLGAYHSHNLVVFLNFSIINANITLLLIFSTIFQMVVGNWSCLGF